MIVRSLLLPLLLTLPVEAVIFGTEDFAYNNGNIAGRTGGSGFNYDNFDQVVTTTTSDWDAVFGTPVLTAGKLSTNNSGAKREYNGNIEGAGNATNDGQDNHERSGAIRGTGRVFYRFDLARSGGDAWSGASSYLFGTERVFFGVPSAANPVSGNLEYGCEVSGTGIRYFSGIPANSTTRNIITVLDFDRDFIGLWVDPDHDDFYTAATGANSCDAGGSYTDNSWSTAVRLGSGAACEWDNLIVATSWSDFAFIDPFTGHTGTAADWDAESGVPQVVSGVLVTQGSGAKREYNGPVEGAGVASDERFGAVNGDPAFSSHAVYYKFEMTRTANATWSGASSFDFVTERYLFGVPGAANPVSGVREFAIHDLNADQWSYSGIVPVPGVKYSLVAKLDFDADVAALYLNPDLASGEGANTPVATYPHTSDNWSTAIRLASGGTGAVQWDNVRVAHSWSDIKDAPPVANDDSATLHHLAKARFKVLANDTGLLAPSSLAIVTPPAHGTATVKPDGTILYQHVTGSPASDSFTYRIQEAGSTLTDTATVTLNFTAAPRFDSAFVAMPASPPVGALRIEEAFPGITFDAPHGFCAVPGDAAKLFVAEGDGRVFVIPNVNTPTKVQVLDHTASVQHDNNELAMKGIAAHPDWANNGRIYVTYNSAPGTVRLSRFTCQTSPPFTAGPEEILIEQDNDDGVHNIGTCEFGPDGYLYVGFGDEGTQADGYNNSQHVDRNLWSCIIRIDVELWVADVGRSNREEVSVFVPGGNDGWGWREGTQVGQRTGNLLNGAPESAATLTAPLWDYPHGGGAYQGQSITGGFVYRGTSLPGLTGKYICADYVSGNVWSVQRTAGAPAVDRLAGEVAIVGLLPDPASGDILLLDRGNNGTNPGIGSIKRLTVGTDDSSFPPTLAATNFFADLADLSPNPGAHFYQPNLRFWSDHAEKKRWFLISTTTDTVGYSKDAPWTYPAGMIWVKHFDYPTQWETFTRSIDGQPRTDRRPVAGSPRRRLETRFLVKNGTGSYGLTYRWNSSQSDALLVDDDGESVPLAITLDGTSSNLTWNIPSRAACITCHTPEAGHALSFNTRQLNLAGSIAGVSGNLLGVLGQTGYLAGLDAAPATLPRHFRPDESAQSLEARVRSYLDVNCAYCHQSGGTGGGNWDGRSHLPLLATGLLNGTPVEAPLDPAHRLVVAGNVPHSILYNRLAGANGYTRMPPLGTAVADLEAEELVTAWIREEVHPYATYEEWRTAKFGNATSPQGQQGQNPEGDGLDNFGEWVFGTDPARMDDFRATPQLLMVAPESGVFRFTHRRLRMHATAGLDYVYRSSGNLMDWAVASVIEESVAVSGTDPAYEVVTVSLAPGSTTGVPRLFVKVEVNP